MIKLGTLVFETGNSYDLLDLFDLAIQADQSGYSRFWLGEHFDMVGLWNNPEPLIPVILGLTENIKVGAAGIILRLHAGFRVACNFKLINAMFPGRVDLGLAGGFTGDLALNKLTGLTAEEIKNVNFEDKISELMSFYTKEEDFVKKDLFVNPYKFPTPEVWILSLSLGRLNNAIKYKTNYSTSIFHSFSSVAENPDLIKKFKEKYYKKNGLLPSINLAFAGICAESKKEAERLHKSSTFYKNPNYIPNILGCENKFYDQIHQYQEIYGIDEFIFLDLAKDIQYRKLTLQKLSETFMLENHLLNVG